MSNDKQPAEKAKTNDKSKDEKVNPDAIYKYDSEHILFENNTLGLQILNFSKTVKYQL